MNAHSQNITVGWSKVIDEGYRLYIQRVCLCLWISGVIVKHCGFNSHTHTHTHKPTFNHLVAVGHAALQHSLSCSDRALAKVPYQMKLCRSRIKKSVQKISPLRLKTHFIKQMVKEDFHSSKYDRAFKCDTGGRQRERHGGNEKRECNAAKERRDRKREGVKWYSGLERVRGEAE